MLNEASVQNTLQSMIGFVSKVHVYGKGYVK